MLIIFSLKILDVARGLAYLHTNKPPIVHGDLKGVCILYYIFEHLAHRHGRIMFLSLMMGERHFAISVYLKLLTSWGGPVGTLCQTRTSVPFGGKPQSFLKMKMRPCHPHRMSGHLLVLPLR